MGGIMRLTKEVKRDIKKWVKALRSGKYKQAQMRLQNNKSYCCLGVACDLFIPQSKKQLNDKGELIGGMPDAQKNAPAWLKDIETDFKIRKSLSLSGLNDDGKRFKTIANLIEKVYLTPKKKK
jgi:hypothetical protein